MMIVPEGVRVGAKRTSSTVERRGEDESRGRSVGVRLLNHHRFPRQAGLGRGLYSLWECGHATETRNAPDPGERFSWWRVVDKPQVRAGSHGPDVLLVLTGSGSQVSSDHPEVRLECKIWS